MIALVHDMLATFVARVTLMALAFASSVLLARLLGPDGRGVFALVLLLPEWIVSLALLGYEQANTVYAGLEPGKRPHLAWHSLVLAAVLGGSLALSGAIYVLAGAPGTNLLAAAAPWLYLLALATVPARFLGAFWGGLLRGMNRIVLLNTIDVGTKIGGLLLLVFLVGWMGLGVPGAVGVDAALAIGGTLSLLAALRALGALGAPRFDRALFVRSTRFALPAYAGTLATYVNYRIDQVMIAAFLPPQELGYYVIAVGIAERLWVLPGSIATPLLPHLTNSPLRDPALPALVARHLFLWLTLVAMILWPSVGLIVPLLYSQAFQGSVAPLRLLLPGIVTLSVGKVLVSELLAREKPSYPSSASAAAALVNVVGNLVLIPRMGISGAALASSISYSLLSLLLAWFYLKETKLPWSVLRPHRTDLALYLRLATRAWSVQRAADKTL